MRISLKYLLTGLVALLLVFSAAQSVTSITKLQSVNANTDDIATNWLPSVRTLGKIRYQVTQYRLSASRLVMETDTKEMQRLSAKLKEYDGLIATSFKEYETMISSPEEKKLWMAFAEGWPAYVKLQREAVDLKIAGKDAEAGLIFTRTAPQFNAGTAALEADIDFNDKGASDAVAQSRATYGSAWYVTIVLSAVAALFAIVAMLLVIFRVTTPLQRLNDALGAMAQGNLDIVIPGAARRDEIGDIAKTVAVIRDNAEQKARAEAAAKAEQDQLLAEQRKRDMRQLADDFEGAVGEIVNTVSSASTELEASASSLTTTAERAQELATVVASASEEASSNVNSVASAAEELTSSVNEISRQVQDTARIAAAAVEQARLANERVGELTKAAGRIGDVVELINTIAGQTNLLALNATIEAARAGEAGRGFAVVASEVKTLAEQTAKATGEISQQVNGIQAATHESVDAIKEIGATIGKMSEIASTIASAVEEQGAATQEISRNVQQAAQGTMQVSTNIADVQRGARDTGSASSEVLSAAQLLSRDSERLKLELGKFLNSVRAA
jgi:methyl-accepting chemotaxis protein